jgi:hypothetical protein
MYDATSVQPIVQGILFVGGTQLAPVPTFVGRGVSRVDFVLTSALPATRMYILTLDAGLIGNAGEIAPGAIPLVPVSGPPAVSTVEQALSARCQFAVRGSASNAGAIGGTSVTSVAVSYQSNGTPGVYNASGGPVTPTTDGGDNQLVLVFQNAAGASIDPNGANANGIEIVVYKAAASSTSVGAG